MIKYNLETINDWFFSTDNIIKVYRNNAICYYKIDSSSPSGQTPCYAVVDDISQYSDTEFEDVFNKADGKWYKLNNLNQYEEYGIYGSGRTITYYEGKLTIDGDYEYQYSGSSWINVGEISGDTHDYSQYYLTLQALESGTIGFSAGTVGYSTDSGSTWNTLTQGNTISVSQGDKVLFKMSGATPNEYTGIGTFTSSCRFNVYGNIMSLQESDNFATATTIYAQFQFKHLFFESKVVNAENMVLPATTLKNFCYNEMFKGSAYLTTPPKIFPATALTQDCYSYSFRGCTSLTKSPVLPALTPARASYGWMFQDCTSLSEVTCLATNVSAQYATYDWLKNVASSGTFYKNPNASWSRGTSGIPSNWSAQDYVEPSPSYEYPVYYDEIQDPPDNLVFSSMAEAEAYECPWVGMSATIDGDRYIFSGDSQSGYEWVYNPSRLPVGYTEVEYIQNTGTSYLDTNFVPNQDTRIVADMQLVTLNDYPRLFGAGGWNATDGINVDYEGGYLLISWFGKTSWTQTTLATNYNRHIYDLNKNYLYVDDTLLVSNTYTTKTASDNLAVFAYIRNGRPTTSNADMLKECFKGKMYSFQIYDNGTLVRDLVPCIRDNDNTVGAYDIVNDVFYTVPTGYTTDKLVAGDPV